MPYESSWPLVAACLLGAATSAFIWLRLQTRGPAILAAVLAVVGLGVLAADRLVVTDREWLRGLFPRLARAAETRDVTTIMAALDPELRPLRDEAEQVLDRVRPTEVRVARIDVVIEAGTPRRAEAKMLVRVTGNVVDERTPGTVVVGVTVRLEKKGDRWLVQDAEVAPVRPGRGG